MKEVKMEKEERIFAILSMATKAIFDTEEFKGEDPAHVIFINNEEFQTVKEGCQPTNYIAEENLLKNWITKVVEKYIQEEKKHWAECCSEEHSDLPVDDDGYYIYNPDLVPGHIYHTIKKLKDFISF